MKYRIYARAAIGAAVLSATVLVPATSSSAVPTASTSVLVEADADGSGSMLGNFGFAISSDNQHVLVNTGEQLVPAADHDASTDAYVIDRETGTPTLASLDKDEHNLGNDDVFAGGMTADGSAVVFSSNQDYFGENSQQAHEDVYLRDVGSFGTRRLSDYAPGEINIDPHITPDGRYVVYLHGLYGSRDTAVIRQDVATGAQVQIAAHGAGASISDDGTKVAYWDSAGLDPNDADVHAYVATVGESGVHTVELDGTTSRHPVLSPDGTHVAFESRDASLSPALSDVDPYFGPWIFVRNLETDAVELASRRSDGQPVGAFLGGASQLFSADNRYLVFATTGNLTADPHALGSVYLRDRATGRTTLMPPITDGIQTVGSASSGGVVSPDGSTVVFDWGLVAYVREHANAPNHQPIAGLTAFATGPTSASFNASGSSDPDSGIDYDQIVQYRFDFDGNGTIDRARTSPGTSFTYSQPGTYHPIVTVVDRYGATASASTTLTLESQYAAAVHADSPLAYYRLGEASGVASAADDAGTKDGTFSGAVVRGVTGATPSDGTSAARFDGKSAAVSLPAPATTIGSNFSIEAWVRFGPADKSAVVATATKGVALRALLGTDTKTGRALRFTLHDDATHAATISSKVPINDGDYHYVVARRSGNVLSLYVDTTLVATGKLPKLFGAVSIDRASVGAKPITGKAKFNTGLNGDIDEVAFYAAALSTAQMSNHFDAAGDGGGGGGGGTN